MENDINMLIKSVEDLKILNINPSFLQTEKVLGSGGFGKVLKDYLINLYAAVKISFVFNPVILLKEILTLNYLRNKDIPLLYGITNKPIKDGFKLGLVFEYISGTTLGDFAKNLINKPNTDLQKLLHFIDLSGILIYLHGMGLIHRDLKPDNIMIDNNLDTKLIDFGISKFTNNCQTLTMVLGTYKYMAPELFTQQTESIMNLTQEKNYVSEKVDVFAFGVILNELFSDGDHPFNDNFNSYQVMGYWISGGTFPASNKIVNEKIKNLVNICTQNDHRQRPSMKVVKSYLQTILRDYLYDLAWLNELSERQSNIYIKFRIFISM